jgi:hypothetical protein
MFTRFTYPFELAALLLTVATIGAVVLARRRDLEPRDEDEIDPDPVADPDAGFEQHQRPTDAGATEHDRVEESARSGVDPGGEG